MASDFRPVGVLVFAMLALTSSGHGMMQKRYDGHEVWTVVPSSQTQLEFLVHLHDHADKYQLDFWKEPSSLESLVMIRLPPNRQTETANLLGLRGIPYQVTITDVQSRIDLEFNDKIQASQPRLNDFNYGVYHPLDEVDSWITETAARFPKRVSLVNISKSFEGRNIRAMKITGTKNNSSKPGFFFNGGMHGREWLSPATVIYIAGQLIEQYGVNPLVTEMVDAFDWYVLPILNPDGYVYTWTRDRLWRKTRSKQPGRCVGVDPNRNFDWKWCTTGASKNPCSEQYCGPKALSEVEVKGVAEFLGAVPGRFRVYLDLHSYSQVWLTPWGYAKKFPVSYAKQDKCAKMAIKALKGVHGTSYRSGPAALTLYPVSGSVMDWAYGSLKIPYTASVELRDTGKYGFLLPADQIIPSGEETLQAILALAKCALT